MNSKPISLTAAILAGCMAVTAAAAHFAKPTLYLADTRAELKIEPSLPTEFAGWKMQAVSGGVVNPQQQQLINILYSETISRTYLSENGYPVMLSIAYGKNQNDTFLLHTPDICYPAQGFSISSARRGELDTSFGVIPVKRLVTKFGFNRPEPVTYWTTLGDYFVKSGTDKKVREMMYATHGYIADGLLFRISSIDPNEERAFRIHQEFAEVFLRSLTPEMRVRLAGLRALN